MTPSGRRWPEAIQVVEVGPRDGLQNEAKAVSTNVKVELIERLAAAGLRSIEAGAFVSPKWVPQMADSAEVFAAIEKRPDVGYPVLVPNMQGYRRAREAGVREIGIFVAASETFSHRNTNCSIAEALDRFTAVCAAAKEDGVAVRGYISTVLGCPYEGAVDIGRVAELAARLRDMGCHAVSLGDTIGVGTPAGAAALVDRVMQEVPARQVAVHFHDTYGQALANILACLDKGIGAVDSSVAGLGGCPYAPGAAGNVATEDLLYMLEGMGVRTGVDLDAVVEAGRFITDYLGRPPASRVALAMIAKRAA